MRRRQRGEGQGRREAEPGWQIHRPNKAHDCLGHQQGGRKLVGGVVRLGSLEGLEGVYSRSPFSQLLLASLVPHLDFPAGCPSLSPTPYFYEDAVISDQSQPNGPFQPSHLIFQQVTFVRTRVRTSASFERTKFNPQEEAWDRLSSRDLQKKPTSSTT